MNTKNIVSEYMIVEISIIITINFLVISSLTKSDGRFIILLYCQPFTLAQFKYCDNIDAQALIEYVVAYLKLSIIICDGIRFHFDPGMKVLIPLLTLQSKMNTDFKSLLSCPNSTIMATPLYVKSRRPRWI